ncbi:MAG TPA: 7-cyano-7-deazaguanine synthase [Candidatus Binataceae bacterium]|nr:7-cyano-7-deazaguanine synthase [Candidatus Binataceae bacterium]
MSLKQSTSDDYRIEPLPGRIAVLASGGLDSSVMLASLARSGRSVYPVYVRAGLSWESSEVATLKRFIRALKIANIEPLTILKLPMADISGDHWSMTGRNVPGYDAAISSNYIPGRNLSLLSKTAIFCAKARIGEIAMAPLESNPFPDARPEFFRAFGRAVELGVGIKLKVSAPFAGMTKADVIKRGANLPLELTVSCAQPKGPVHCGACTKCAERIEGFTAAGVVDPTAYARKPRRK